LLLRANCHQRDILYPGVFGTNSFYNLLLILMQQPLTKVLTLCCLHFFNLPYSTRKARQCMSPKLSLPLSLSTELRFCFQSFLCVSLSPGSVVIHLNPPFGITKLPQPLMFSINASLANRLALDCTTSTLYQNRPRSKLLQESFS
jgi:hypothetical protein